MPAINTRPNTKLAMDFQVNKLSVRLSILSDAYFPANKAKASLVNLPTKNAGIIYNALILEIPAAKNNGVVGRGSKEYAKTNSCPFHIFSFNLDPKNSTSSFLDLLINLFAMEGIYSVRIYLPKTEPITPIISTGHTAKPKVICRNTIMVKAGRKGKGTISNNKAPTNTNIYCHHIRLLILY